MSEYAAALHGFAAKLPQRALDALRSNPNVDFIEADQIMGINATQSPATGGLDRVDQRNLPLSNSYTYTVAGAGVTAYVIDTGIRFTHTDFGGRAVRGCDAIDGGSADDCNGHGTHVSGTVGGTTYGIAKQVSIVGVRVLNCRRHAAAKAHVGNSELTRAVISCCPVDPADNLRGGAAALRPR